MWLPMDERRLLAGYFRNIEKPGEEQVYRVEELMKLLGRRKLTIRSYLEPRESESSAHASGTDNDESKKGRLRRISQSARVELANMLLDRRELIKLTPHEGVPGVFVIELTLEGYDLGRRYANWVSSTGLCYQEVRNHWIFALFAAVVGVLGTLAVQWLARPPVNSG